MLELSVVMATARSGSWLNLAIESVLRESDVNLEFLVVFDGITPDNSSDWVHDPRVTRLHNRVRCGVAASARRGIQSSTGEYVARLDSDDVSEPGRFGAQLEYLRRHREVQCVAGRAWRINNADEVTGELGVHADDDVRQLLATRNVLMHSASMFPREAYESAGGYDSRMLQMEDYDLWLRMALVGPLAIMEDYLIRYRVHDLQMSRKSKPFTTYARKIMASQYRLSRHMGNGPLQSMSSPALWNSAQLLRQLRIRRLRYDRHGAWV